MERKIEAAAAALDLRFMVRDTKRTLLTPLELLLILSGPQKNDIGHSFLPCHKYSGWAI